MVITQITMDDPRITSIAQLKEFLNASRKAVVSFNDQSISGKYQCVDETLKKFSYMKLPKKDKRIVLVYLQKLTGYKKERLYKLVGKREKGLLKKTLYKRANPTRNRHRGG